MDPCIRKTTKPYKIPSTPKPSTSSSEKTILVTSLCRSPEKFARQIINEEKHLTAAEVYDTICTNLLTETSEIVNLISPIHSPIETKENTLKDLEVSDTDSEQTKIELRKSYLNPQTKTKKAAKTPCGYMIKKGSRKGQSCNLPTLNESKLCSMHRPTRSLGKTSDLETRVEYLEKKVKSLNQLLTRWMNKKQPQKLKLKNISFASLKKLSRTDKFYFKAMQPPNKVLLKCGDKTFIIKSPKSLSTLNLNEKNYLKFDETTNKFQWY